MRRQVGERGEPKGAATDHVLLRVAAFMVLLLAFAVISAAGVYLALLTSSGQWAALLVR